MSSAANMASFKSCDEMFQSTHLELRLPNLHAIMKCRKSAIEIYLQSWGGKIHV